MSPAPPIAPPWAIELLLLSYGDEPEPKIPLYPNPETPFAIELPRLTIANGRLSIP